MNKAQLFKHTINYHVAQVNLEADSTEELGNWIDQYPSPASEGIDQCCHAEEQHCECIAAYRKISNRGNQQNRSGEDPVLRCELSQLFPIEEDQASSDKIDCTVQNICPCAEIYCCSICNVTFIKEICATHKVVDYSTNKDQPCTFLVFQQKAEKGKQQIKHKNHCQRPAHTNNRYVHIRQKSLA